MSNRKTTDIVAFRLGIGFVGANHSDTQTLADLGLDDQEDLDAMEEREIEDFLDEQLREWAGNYIDMNWSFE